MLVVTSDLLHCKSMRPSFYTYLCKSSKKKKLTKKKRDHREQIDSCQRQVEGLWVKCAEVVKSHLLCALGSVQGHTAYSLVRENGQFFFFNCEVCQLAIIAEKSWELQWSNTAGGREALLFKLNSQLQASLRRYHFSLSLSQATEQTMWISVGVSLQTEGTADAEVLGQEWAWCCLMYPLGRAVVFSLPSTSFSSFESEHHCQIVVHL